MRFSKALSFLALWLCISMHGQNKQLLYDFTDIPQALMVNPAAEVDFKWYAGLPAMSGLSFQAGSSGFSAFDLFANDGLSFGDKVQERLLDVLTVRDELSGTYQFELLNVGFRGRHTNMFYSFGIYNEGDAIGYWFKDYAHLLIEGNANKLNRRFDLSDFKTRGEIVNVFHFGVNKQVSRALTLGARAKLYSSILDFNSTGNEGVLVNRRGNNNLISTNFNADLELRTSGVQALKDANDEGTIGNAIFKRGFFGGNLGLGFDLGFSYKLNDQTMVTGSLLDIGFIYHSNSVENYTIKGEFYSEGTEAIFPNILTNPDDGFWTNIVDDLESLVAYEKNNDSYITFRPTKLNGSLRYNWGEQSLSGVDCNCGPNVNTSNRSLKYRNGVGGQIYMIMRPRGPQAAITAFYTRRIGSFMALKASYSLDKFSPNNIGLGLNLQIGPVNMYFLADNLLAYKNVVNSRYQSFQLGLNIISWGKK